MVEQIKFSSKEAEFLSYQLVSRKDCFQKEMTQGVESVVRLKELNFIMDTLDKGIEFFTNKI